MGDVLVNGQAFFEESPFEAFHKFGRREQAGWLLSARFDATEAGAIAEMRIPVPDDVVSGPARPTILRGTGRIVETVPWRRITLRQESPWSAETIITFTPRDGGTLVRATSTITPDAVGWMNRHLGEPIDSEPDDALTIGLVCSLSGEAGLFGRATLNCAQLAADEVNRDGGVLGRPVRIVHVDEATSGEVALRRLSQLEATHDMVAVIGSHTSSTLNALRPRILASGILYLFAPVNEGYPREGNLFRFGESSHDQLQYTIPELSQRTGGRRWYIVGNDYSWPREIGRVARKTIERIGGSVVGEQYLPLQSPSFDEVLDDIRRSGAEMLVSGLIGYDSVDFERSFVAAGLRDQVVTLAALLEDSTLDHLGSLADGIWSSMSYFSGDAASQGFQQRYREAWGVHSPPPSAISASVYDSVHLWARAAGTARSTTPADVAAALPGTTVDGARGVVAVTRDGTLSTDIFLAQARARKFEIIDSYRTHNVG